MKRDKPDITRFCLERGYRPQYIYAWLQGRLPRAGHLGRLASDLGVSPAWLMFGEQDMPAALTGAVTGQMAGTPSARLGPGRPRATPPGWQPQGPPRRTPASPLRVLDFGRLRELTEQLSQVQAQLEGVFRAFPDRYLWLDADGTVLSCHGPEDPGAVAGLSLGEVFPAGPAGPLTQAFLRTLRTNSLATLEYTAHEAGEARHFEARFVPLGEAPSRRRQVLLIIRDITERKRLEEQLRERDRAYVSLLCNLSGMAYRCRDDERWTMELVSDGCQALTGYGASDLTGNRVVAFAELIHREDRQRVWEQCQASLGAGVPCSSEYRIVTAGGEEKWVWDQAHGVYGPSGELLAVEGLVTDITPRKRAEEVAAALALQNAELYRGARDLADRLQTVNRLNRLVSSTLDQDEVLQAISQAAADLMGVPLAVFFLPDEAAMTLSAHAASEGPPAADLPVPVLAFGQSAAGWVAVHRAPLHIADVFADARIAHPEWWRKHGLGSLLALPVLRGGVLLGVLALCSPQPFRLDAADQQLLDSLLAQAAEAIRNARLFAASESARQAAEALAEIGRLLSETLDPEVVAQRITDRVRTLFGAQSSAVYRLDVDAGHLVGLTGSGEMGPAFRPGIVMPRGNGAVGLAVETGEPVATLNVLADRRITLTAEVRDRIEAAPYRAVLAVPLAIHDRVIGALSAADAEGRRFSPEDIHLARAFAAHAALALENARLYRQAAGTRQ